MIIYFEGLSCAGKTKLINNLINYLNQKKDLREEKILHVNEIFDLAVDYNSSENINNCTISNDICLKSDEKKCDIAKKNRCDLVLVDRSYASTLAYNYINYKLRVNKSYLYVEKWYRNNVGNKLIKPDLYVFIEISPETSLKRARSIGRYTKKYAWYLKPQEAINYYNYFFSVIENDIPIIRVNGEKNIGDVFNEFIKKYNDFIKKS